jgi:hypothetical protein
LNDFEALINHSLKMAEQLLLEQDGEFYPFAASIGMDGALTPLALYLGEEFPASDSMITGFQNLLKQRIQENVYELMPLHSIAWLKEMTMQ